MRLADIHIGRDYAIARGGRYDTGLTPRDAIRVHVVSHGENDKLEQGDTWNKRVIQGIRVTEPDSATPRKTRVIMSSVFGRPWDEHVKALEEKDRAQRKEGAKKRARRRWVKENLAPLVHTDPRLSRVSLVDAGENGYVKVPVAMLAEMLGLEPPPE